MKFWSVDRLDELMSHFDEGYAISHDEAYRRFAQNSLIPPSNLPADPFSAEYRDRLLDLYKAIASKDGYDVVHERSHFSVEDGYRRPFPYFTASLKLAGIHFTMMGKLLSLMEDLKPSSRILECGFGWGNTTLALALLGHQVTGLDIEENFCRLVAKRAEQTQVQVELVNADFFWVETTDKRFDAVCFFEAFHHCWQFEGLLRALDRVLLPGGKIFFGAEPINRGFAMPWGVRLDGESLMVARKWGWMELGFQSDFFDALLKRTGWIGYEVEPGFWIAMRPDDPYAAVARRAPKRKSGTWARMIRKIRFRRPSAS